MSRQCYQTPWLQLLLVPDVIRTSDQKPPLKAVESGFGDEMDF